VGAADQANDQFQKAVHAYKAGDYATAVRLWRPLAEQCPLTDGTPTLHSIPNRHAHARQTACATGVDRLAAPHTVPSGLANSLCSFAARPPFARQFLRFSNLGRGHACGNEVPSFYGVIAFPAGREA